jgi:hypothetical protein
MENAFPKSRLDELGTEPVAVATGYFNEITRLLPQAVPHQIGDPTHILSYGAKPMENGFPELLLSKPKRREHHWQVALDAYIIDTL